MKRDSSQMQARLAALADGTLAPGEREQLLEQIGQRPELAGELERQRQALSVLATLQSTRAPDTLRRTVESLAASAPPAKRRDPLRLRLAAAGALAALAAAGLAIVLTTSNQSQPTLMQAADVALRAATLPAPPESPTRHDELARSVEGIPYPYWQDSLGWQATGARTDRIAGRTVNTVFYAPQARAGSASKRIGYAIVTGDTLALPASGRVIHERGIRLELLRSDGATVLTWRRAGHTCILVGRGVSGAQLARLATWQ